VFSSALVNCGSRNILALTTRIEVHWKNTHSVTAQSYLIVLWL